MFVGPLIVAVLTLAAVLVTLDPADSRPNLPPGPGITLDESFNVQMGVYLVESLKNYGLGILDLRSVEEVFGDAGYNPDHPPLGRLWLGVFHEISREVAPVESGDNPFVTIHARAGSAVAFALTVLLVGVFAGTRWGTVAGITSSVSLAVMPRLFGHAHLASLETFLGLVWTTAILGTVSLWNRPQGAASIDVSELNSKADELLDPRRVSKPPGDKAAIVCGFLTGLALLTKMQAVLLPPLIAAWALWHWRFAAVRPLLVSCLSTTVIFVVGWPWLWLWLDLPGHLAEYFGRTTGRVSLNVWYLNQVFKDVDVPWHYPWLMTFVTVPTGILLLAAAGLWQTRRELFTDQATSLVCGSVIAPLVLFSLPGVAVYDGVRLFLIVFPGIAVLAGLGAVRISNLLMNCKLPHKTVLGCFLAMQLTGLATTTPYFLSYYNLVIGGLPGAERLGFEVTYWGDSFSRSFLSELVERVPDNAVIQVAPVLHQFQLEELERQVPMLSRGAVESGRRLRLAPAQQHLTLALSPFPAVEANDHKLNKSTQYLAVFHRRADAPSAARLELAGWKLVASEACQGVIVASLWQRSSAATGR